VPYEFNTSDLEASLLFLEKHIANTVMMNQPLSWTTIRYMICEVQYGGRITDDADRDLFIAFGKEWVDEKIMGPNFAFNQSGEVSYKIFDALEI